jgi:hypothetical protein
VRIADAEPRPRRDEVNADPIWLPPALVRELRELAASVEAARREADAACAAWRGSPTPPAAAH